MTDFRWSLIALLIAGCVAEPAPDSPLEDGAQPERTLPRHDGARAVERARRALVHELRTRFDDDADLSGATELFVSRRSELGLGASELDTPYDVLLYNLDLDIDSTARTFDAKVDVVLLVTRRTREVALDVGVESIIGERTYNPYTVTSVRRGFRRLDYEQDTAAGVLSIDLDRAARPFEIVTLTLGYNGEFNPSELNAVGLVEATSAIGEPIVQTFSWPNFARMWLPSVDHPRDPASWIADVSIDNGLTLLSNGTMIRDRVTTDPTGATRTERTFVMLQPVPTYALQVISGDYVQVSLGEVDGVPLSAYVYPVDESFAAEIFAEIPAALEYFNDTFGPYPFQSFAMLEVPSAYGGMEHATMVSLNDFSFFPGSTGARDIGIHELSHHWFGDNLHQSEWQAFWLNESLATYATDLAIGHLDGPEAYTRELLDVRDSMFGFPFAFDDAALHFAPPEEIPGETTAASFRAPYYKGPWIWHMLRVELGDEVFFGFLRDFTEESYFRAYDTESVLAALEEYSGHDLRRFFDEWVYQRGWPRVEVTSAFDASAGTATVSAQQVQNVADYGTYSLTGNLALRFELDDEDPATPSCPVTIELVDGDLEESVTIACAHEPTEIRATNGDDLLVEILMELDPTAPCESFGFGENRDCDWTVIGAFDCTAGDPIEVGCGAMCMLGTCTGDPMLRICDGESACLGRNAISSDDQSCGGNCPVTSFVCPASGRYTVLSAPWASSDTYSCMIESR
jgi:aminopeptidase N